MNDLGHIIESQFQWAQHPICLPGVGGSRPYSVDKVPRHHRGNRAHHTPPVDSVHLLPGPGPPRQQKELLLSSLTNCNFIKNQMFESLIFESLVYPLIVQKLKNIYEKDKHKSNFAFHGNFFNFLNFAITIFVQYFSI